MFYWLECDKSTHHCHTVAAQDYWSVEQERKLQGEVSFNLKQSNTICFEFFPWQRWTLQMEKHLKGFQFKLMFRNQGQMKAVAISIAKRWQKGEMIWERIDQWGAVRGDGCIPVAIVFPWCFSYRICIVSLKTQETLIYTFIDRFLFLTYLGHSFNQIK